MNDQSEDRQGEVFIPHNILILIPLNVYSWLCGCNYIIL